MIDLQTLHAAGAEVGGVHADAWLRMPGIKSGEFAHKHDSIADRVRKLHAQLGRRILPTDLTGAPVPLCAGGEIVRAKPPTPHRIAQDNSVSLTPEQVRSVQVVVEQMGTRELAAKKLGINANTITRALAGERLMPETIARIMGNLSSPDGDIDPPAPADAPVRPLPGEAPGQATITTPPAQEADMPDPLLTKLLPALAGYGVKSAFAKAIGRSPSCLCDWKKSGKIPEDARATVEAWLEHPPTAAVAKPKAKAVEKKPKAKAAKVVPPWEQPEQKPTPTDAQMRGMITEMGLVALGLSITEAWLPDGETMRKVRVAVLP